MTPEEKSLLERTLRMAEENNKILRGLRRSNRWSTVIRVIYWLIIIGLSIGAFYYIQPYVNTLVSVYSQLGGNATSAQNAADSLKNIFK